MNHKKLLQNYAELAIKVGINLQKGQTLVINAQIECYEFVRVITSLAYESGAKNVHVEWHDDEITLIKYLKAPEEALKEYPAWKANAFEELAKNDTAFLYVTAANPELFKSVDPEKIATVNKAASKALQGYRKYIMNNLATWCSVSIPSKSWAKKVFPDLNEDEAVDMLWKNIFSIVRADVDNPIGAWKNHIDNLSKKIDYLNEKRFKYLHYKSALTDLEIELHEDHVWGGGGEYNEHGVYFVSNLPTEEVFTVPLKNGVNGKLTSTKPLNYSGNLINNFTLSFKDGKIVDFQAEEGYELLKKLIEIDEGAHYLGEVALVPYTSPISQSGLVFYNTLYDENASCHLAIGRGYGTSIKNGAKLSEKELEAKGVNYSLTHNDFMIGSSDLDIIGETASGEKIYIFKNGEWAF